MLTNIKKTPNIKKKLMSQQNNYKALCWPIKKKKKENKFPFFFFCPDLNFPFEVS